MDDAARTKLNDRIGRLVADGGGAGVGVCAADPFPDVADDMARRKAEGSHAGLTFTYRDPATATDVRHSFPWAERLVVVAHGYLPEAGSPGDPAPGTGRIARFATEDHYVPLRRLLEEVRVLLVAEGFAAEVLTDDNRLVDRAAAVRAGVGWWGKSAMVLTPGHGPWLLLGSVVTDAPLPTSEPMRRDCGTCTACLPACPTGALVAPGILDARRCLARWAQAPGVMPRPLRRPMGDRIYGCDDCLDACPPGRRMLDEAETRRGRVDLVELLGASDAELLARYHHFYLPGRRAGVLRRNALIALGNAPGEGALEVVAGYLGHPDPVLRIHAAWALGEIGGDAATAVLSQAVAAEPDPEVRSEIAHALR